MKDDGCILMIAAFGQGRDGMSHASCALRDAWRQKRIGFEAVDFFENGGAGVGVKASDKIKSTIRNRRIAKDLAKEATACYITPKLSPLGFLSCIPYFRLCRKNKLPYTLHFHGRALLGTYQKHILLRPAIKKWISCAHKNIALTPSLQKEMQQLLGGAGDWTAVGNFAGNDMMISAAELEKKRSVYEQKPLQICYLSNVIGSKGIFELMHAVAGDERFSLKIAGGVFPDEQQRFNKILEGSRNMQYLGFLSGQEKRRLLTESAVLVLPTRYPTEAQPISIIEALCMGCAVIATPLPGILDTLGEYPAELIVEKNALSVKAALESVYNEPEKYYEFIKSNMDACHQRFSVEHFAAEIYKNTAVRAD